MINWFSLQAYHENQKKASNVTEEDVDGMPLDDADIDGAPLSDSEDLDGVPLDGAALLRSAVKLQSNSPSRSHSSKPKQYDDDDDDDDVDGVPSRRKITTFFCTFLCGHYICLILVSDADGISSIKSSSQQQNYQRKGPSGSSKSANAQSKWEVDAPVLASSKWDHQEAEHEAYEQPPRKKKHSDQEDIFTDAKALNRAENSSDDDVDGVPFDEETSQEQSHHKDSR